MFSSKLKFLIFVPIFFSFVCLSQDSILTKKIDSISYHNTFISTIYRSDSSIIGRYGNGEPISKVSTLYFGSDSNNLNMVVWISEFHIRDKAKTKFSQLT